MSDHHDSTPALTVFLAAGGSIQAHPTAVGVRLVSSLGGKTVELLLSNEEARGLASEMLIVSD